MPCLAIRCRATRQRVCIILSLSTRLIMDWKWSHATNSLEKVAKAASEKSISAVECDIVLGTATERGVDVPGIPILAHPPYVQSDISFKTLIVQLTREGANGQKVLMKHLKLDFKEIGAVEPSLELLQLSNIANPLGKVIFLNADILPGPGRRDDKIRPVSADRFLSCSLNHIHSQKVRWRRGKFCMASYQPAPTTHHCSFQLSEIFRIRMFCILSP